MLIANELAEFTEAQWNALKEWRNRTMTDINKTADHPRIRIQARKAAECLKSGATPSGKMGFAFDDPTQKSRIRVIAVEVSPAMRDGMATQALADYIFDKIMEHAEPKPPKEPK